jgi:hypothetical protein
MPKYTASLSNPGGYNVPNGRTLLGAGKYDRVVSASATFTCTGSFGGVVGLTTSGCTVSLIGGGSVTLGSITSPIELSVYQITAGSAFLYYR